LFFLFLANPSREQPARYLIKAGMRATVGFKRTPLYLHETGARVNKHFREFNDFSTICGMSDAFVNPYFRHPFVMPRPTRARDDAGPVSVNQNLRPFTGPDPASTMKIFAGKPARHVNRRPPARANCFFQEG
jgi:hypothetical protein